LDQADFFFESAPEKIFSSHFQWEAIQNLIDCLRRSVSWWNSYLRIMPVVIVPTALFQGLFVTDTVLEHLRYEDWVFNLECALLVFEISFF